MLYTFFVILSLYFSFYLVLDKLKSSNHWCVLNYFYINLDKSDTPDDCIMKHIIQKTLFFLFSLYWMAAQTYQYKFTDRKIIMYIYIYINIHVYI